MIIFFIILTNVCTYRMYLTNHIYNTNLLAIPKQLTFVSIVRSIVLRVYRILAFMLLRTIRPKRYKNYRSKHIVIEMFIVSTTHSAVSDNIKRRPKNLVLG
jgi:TRAP-type C4-dicarboxylate transport system permease small subunit